ncbi:hypothetical protein AB0756_39990 [Tolypothrix campylonemoides VB511288_2]|uniref:Uncharacterized protein n=1 Tax=Tolypothrix campylonemoides VB511288_2 TaxID=3232311 RepID=A0ABW8XMN2_9CYAN
MNKPSPFKKLFENREEPQPETEQSAEPAAKEDAPQPTPKPEPKKRGRPATGKRSDDAWIGRTYYVKRETDLDVEEELLKLRRQGIDIDKSELVDFLMNAWVKWRKGENIDLLIDEFSPRRNSKID